jgi:hypothetical protein
MARSKLSSLVMIRLQSKLLLSVAVLLTVFTFPALAAPVLNTEPAANQAKNLARMNCGAQIECITPDGRVTHVTPAAPQNSETAALIMDDDTVSCSLQEGETNFVIALPNTALLDRFTFLNENAAAQGELKISVSNYRLPANSHKWTPVEGAVPFSHKRLFDLSLLGVEAKFVKLSFHVEKQGRVAALGLYGQQSLTDFADRQSHVTHVSNHPQSDRDADRINFNFANVYARAHVIFVSSGLVDGATKMIDDDPITAFQFAADDPHPTVIVELSATQRLHRVSALYEMHSGRLDVYAIDQLPNDIRTLNDLKPVASAVDSEGEGKASVNFDPLGARYVALRWTPNQSRTSHESFRVAEIDAFGNVPLGLIDWNRAPSLFAANSVILKPFPGESPPDFSNTLGTPADPPVISP